MNKIISILFHSEPNVNRSLPLREGSQHQSYDETANKLEENGDTKQVHGADGDSSFDSGGTEDKNKLSSESVSDR